MTINLVFELESGVNFFSFARERPVLRGEVVDQEVGVFGLPQVLELDFEEAGLDSRVDDGHAAPLGSLRKLRHRDPDAFLDGAKERHVLLVFGDAGTCEFDQGLFFGPVDRGLRDCLNVLLLSFEAR